ncbi:ABC transporter ATP-binding protein [Candidatus Poribacteria bacterium]|nr:ABC transporter ATP-binding protein [Candidatus Poribacteria bacterium]
MSAAVKTVELTKVFKSVCFAPRRFRLAGIRQRQTVALDSLSLEVEAGEIFGYLGPNGAGKTTTFKLLVGLLHPTSGEAWLLGNNIRDIDSRREIGFLPEQPYFYDYLTAREFLDFYCQLYHLSKPARKKRVTELLELVGLQEVAAVQLRKFSRGMLQRIGVAQALINEPKLVFFDEPMSGLDPIGRKQMRDVILRLKAEGKTVIYSSHILSDVEEISDRVAILSKGKLHGVGQLNELLGGREQLVEMSIERLDETGKAKIKELASESIERGNRIIAHISDETALKEAQDIVVQQSARLVSLIPRTESLDELFARKVGE